MKFTPVKVYDPCGGWDGRGCGNTGPRGRLSDGKWSGMCEPCTEKFIEAIANWNAKQAIKKGTFGF